jgi:hypothetical protein
MTEVRKKKMQKTIRLKIIVSMTAVMLILSIITCASTRDIKRVEMEKLLKAAGFKMGVADTPEKLAELKKLPQRKIVPHEDGDKLVYIYADAENCKCAFAGDEEAYKKYQKLDHAKQIADEDRRDAVRNKQSQMDSDDNSFGRDW